MKAVGSTRPLPITDSEALQDRELPKPDPLDRDLLVCVEAVSVNPVDTKIRRSQAAEHQEGALRVLGWDVAGVVDSVGRTLVESGGGLVCSEFLLYIILTNEGVIPPMLGEAHYTHGIHVRLNVNAMDFHHVILV